MLHQGKKLAMVSKKLLGLLRASLVWAANLKIHGAVNSIRINLDGSATTDPHIWHGNEKLLIDSSVGGSVNRGAQPHV